MTLVHRVQKQGVLKRDSAHWITNQETGSQRRPYFFLVLVDFKAVVIKTVGWPWLHRHPEHKKEATHVGILTRKPVE